MNINIVVIKIMQFVLHGENYSRNRFTELKLLLYNSQASCKQIFVK